MESKLRNQLAMHLDIAIRMFVQDFFTKETFLFQVAIMHWNDGNKVRIGMNAWLLSFIVPTFFLWIASYYFVLFCYWANLRFFWRCMQLFYMGLKPWTIWSLKVVTCKCVFYLILIMFCLYIEIITLLTTASTLCCNGQGPCDQGSNPMQGAGKKYSTWNCYMLSNFITYFFARSLKSEHHYMCAAYSCTHRYPSRSHFKPLQLQNALPNVHCCNKAT